MNKYLTLAALAILSLINLPLAAQKQGSYEMMGTGFDALNEEWLQRNTAQIKLEEEVRTYGSYEIRMEPRLQDGHNGPCLWDNATGKYILAPATPKEIKEFEKLDKKNIVPVGTFIPVRMYFLDSQKGPMAGCPERFNGCIWIDSFTYFLPDSVYNEGVRVPNVKKVTSHRHESAIYRIENGTLNKIVSFGDLSNCGLWSGARSSAAFYWAKESWTKIRKDEYEVHHWLDLLEPLGHGTEYLVLSTSHFKTDRYIRKTVCNYYQWWEVRLLDWNGKEVAALDGNKVSTDGKFIWVHKDGKDTPLDLELNPLFPQYSSVEPQTLPGVGQFFIVSNEHGFGLIDANGNVVIPPMFKDEVAAERMWMLYTSISYTRWYKLESLQYANHKGEFEKTADFEARMANPDLQEAYIKEMMANAEQLYIDKFKEKYDISLGTYNADEETFPIYVNKAPWNGFSLRIPIDQAQAFKAAFDGMKAQALEGASYCIRNDSISLKEITFTLPDGTTYSCLL